MKITKDTLNQLPKKESNIIESLLEDYHDTYSPERVDPCPDYYGCYTLMTENEELYKQKFGYVDCTLSEKLPLNDFESVFFAIIEFIDFLNSLFKILKSDIFS